jgi:hypothetical protein
MILFYMYAFVYISFVFLSAGMDGTERLMNTLKSDYTVFVSFSSIKKE